MSRSRGEHWSQRLDRARRNPAVVRFWNYLLPSIFVILSIERVVLAARGGLGSDAVLYYGAGANWLAGLNPWDAFGTFAGTHYHFSAAPTAAILMAPFSFIPVSIFVPAWIGLQAAAAVFVVRRLKLPIWWLLFPPIVEVLPIYLIEK